MKENKIYQPEQRALMRSQVKFADYNPRIIKEDARKALKANLKRVGLLGGIVWNERTGNIVSGHQRVAAMDAVNRYNPQTGENDYEFKAEVVDFDIKTEKEQNLFMNNKSVQGEFDNSMLRKMMDDIDVSLTGFTDFDLELLGIGGEDEDDFAKQIMEEPRQTDEWRKEHVTENNEAMQRIDEATMNTGESRVDRSANFYNDTPENQLARHNEVQKIKDRINNKASGDNDHGALSYVVLSFDTPSQKENFMERWGFNPLDKYIDGNKFEQMLEFGE